MQEGNAHLATISLALDVPADWEQLTAPSGQPLPQWKRPDGATVSLWLGCYHRPPGPHSSHAISLGEAGFIHYEYDEWTCLPLHREEDPTECECDNTHQSVDTVCRWCWSRGRRHWNDPEVT